MSEATFGYQQNTGNLTNSGAQAFSTAGKSVTTAPGCLFHLSAVNKSTTTGYFIQIHDKATAPVNSDVPVWEGKLAAGSDWSVGFQGFGLYLVNGLALAISTTAGSLTLDGAATGAVAYARYTKPSP